MSLERNVIYGAKWSAIGAWSRRLVSFVVFAVVTRYVQPDSLGLIALATIYIGLVEMFAQQGIGMALIREKDLKPEHLNAAFLIGSRLAWRIH